MLGQYLECVSILSKHPVVTRCMTTVTQYFYTKIFENHESLKKKKRPPEKKTNLSRSQPPPWDVPTPPSNQDLSYPRQC